jgi:hypothetical protein
MSAAAFGHLLPFKTREKAKPISPRPSFDGRGCPPQSLAIARGGRGNFCTLVKIILDKERNISL